MNPDLYMIHIVHFLNGGCWWEPIGGPEKKQQCTRQLKKSHSCGHRGVFQQEALPTCRLPECCCSLRRPSCIRCSSRGNMLLIPDPPFLLSVGPLLPLHLLPVLPWSKQWSRNEAGFAHTAGCHTPWIYPLLLCFQYLFYLFICF